MGSNSSPTPTSGKPQQLPVAESSADAIVAQTTIAPASSTTPTTANPIHDLSAPELRLLLELRDQEIQALKFELEKYKLALHQSQLDYHLIQQKQSNNKDNKAHDNVLDSQDEQALSNDIGALIGSEEADDNEDNDEDEEIEVSRRQAHARRRRRKRRITSLGDVVKDATVKHQPKMSNKLSRLSATSIGSSVPSMSSAAASKIAFEATDDRILDGKSDQDNQRLVATDNDLVRIEREENHQPLSGTRMKETELDGSDDNIEDIIQDVGEIDLNLELGDDEEVDSKSRRRQQKGKKANPKIGPRCKRSGSSSQERGEINVATAGADAGDDDDEDIISDGLLTSLTDAAINNLSQLAALQERCESQQHSHQHQYQQQQQKQQQQSASQSRSQRLPSTGPPLRTSSGLGLNQQQQQDPFSASAIVSQAAMAINAAASIQSSSSMISQTVSSSSSISPNSTIQPADLSSSHSLASVVVAAAAAAAAANDQQNQHQPQLNPQTRLIASAAEFYPQSHHHHHHNLHQLTSSQHHPHAQATIQHNHPAHHHQTQQSRSPVSSLQFSSSSSITPSPVSSLMAQSSAVAAARRSVTSTALSSLMSPIASPSYLRRQFMPDRLPLLSSSPTTSGLATGSSSGASTSLAHHSLLAHHHQQRSASAIGTSPLTTSSGTPISVGGTSSSTAVSPLMSNKNSSQARLNNMQIRHKFGYLGSGRAQFNSPHGFCLGLNQEIVVADTNNHRVCIFDKSGTYITQFGSPGKEEGQLWNPRKVAILHRPIMQGSNNGANSTTKTATNNSSSTNSSSTTSSHHHLHHIHQQQHHNLNQQQQTSSPYSSHSNSLHNSNGNQSLVALSEPLYVVCDRGAERSRMQLFTKDGAFIKKIGIHYIDIVAGLAITQNGLIIVVDSVSPTVYIINGETGILNGWFDCSGHMKEPSDIAVKSDVPGNEYFICDFKGHCVVVFSEQGEYLRKIGQDGLTSYPNGIDISDDGDILVGDSHGNRFHVVVFDRNGNFVSQFECPHVKVSRCCGLKITREGYIVTLAKNNHHVLVLDTIHI